MAPKRRRKTLVGVQAKKKKEEQEVEQQEVEQQQEQQQEEVTKRSSSCTGSDHDDDDDVRLISPPSTNTTTNIITIMSSNKKKGKRGKQISAHKVKIIGSLKETIQPVPISNTHIADFSKHEKIFQKLGLWDFANMDIDLEPRSDELAQLVITYEHVAHTSIVNNVRLRLSRPDLARALKVYSKKEKSTLEIPDFKAPPGYPIESCSEEGIRTVLYFISSRVCPCDDPSLTTEEMVGFVENALKSEQNVDWASLIWSRAEKELLQGKSLVKFYYAWHFQQLIMYQKPEILGSNSLGHEEEGVFMSKTRTLEDLDVVNACNEDEVPESGGTVDEKQEDCLQLKLENAENDGTAVGDDEIKAVGGDDSKDVGTDVLDQQGVEENEGDEGIRDEEDKHSNGDLMDSILRPCSNDVTEKGESDEGSKDLIKSQTDSEKLDGDIEVSSHGGSPSAENPLSEFEKDRVSNIGAFLEKPTLPQEQLAEFENGIVQLEKSIAEESQFLGGDKDMMLNSAIHVEKTTSAEQMIFEIEKGMPLNQGAHLQRPTSEDHHLMMPEIEKDMTLNSTLNLQRSSSAENLILLMSQGPSHSGNVRKREIDEDSEFHGDPEKKPRPDDSLGFETCMVNVCEWVQRAQSSYMNERELLNNRANMEIQQVYQQLQQRDYLIQSLQMNKQEELQQRAMEYNKLKSNMFLTNKTFFGYMKALDEAQDTIHHLRETIRQQNTTIESLHQQLQQKQNFMAEAELYLKEQISQYMQERYEKFMLDFDKGMHKQLNLEEKLDMLKAEIEKLQTGPPV